MPCGRARGRHRPPADYPRHEGSCHLRVPNHVPDSAVPARLNRSQLNERERWWRQQTIARGLGGIVDSAFKAWADDTATRIGDDDANNQLFGASLLASHLGSQGAWRHLAGLTGCNMLMRLDRHAEPQSARAGVEELRLAGATSQLTLAAKKFAADGPATAVTLALAIIDLNRSTRTTAGADLALLKTGGHLADAPTTAQAVNQLLSILDDPRYFFTRTTASKGVVYEIVESLAGIIPAAHAACCDAIREHVLALDGVENQLLAMNYAKVVRALPSSTWNEDAAARAGKAADTHHDALGLTLLGIAALHNDAASERLIRACPRWLPRSRHSAGRRSQATRPGRQDADRPPH